MTGASRDGTGTHPSADQLAAPRQTSVKPPPEASARVEARIRRRRRLAAYAAPLLLLAFVLLFSLARPATFLSVANFKTILSTNSILLVLTLAAVVTLVAGQFDLSIGANLGLSGVVTVEAMTILGLPVPLAVLLGLATGVIVGVVNGLLVARVGLSSIVVTLGMSTVAVGLTLAITNGRVLFGAPESFTTLGRAELLGLRATVWYAAVVTVALFYLLEHTPRGRYFYALGANPDAARLVGVPVSRLTFQAFVLDGGLAGLAGVMQVSILGSGHPGTGPPLLLPAFAAAFLGATTIRPGRYNVRGAAVAVLLIATGVAGLQLMGVPFFIEPVFNGVALVGAVVLAKVVAVVDVGAGKL